MASARFDARALPLDFYLVPPCHLVHLLIDGSRHPVAQGVVEDTDVALVPEPPRLDPGQGDRHRLQGHDQRQCQESSTAELLARHRFPRHLSYQPD